MSGSDDELLTELYLDVMDTIYSMYGVYLYDNQLNHDYLIFYNNKNLDIFHIT
jgi:hypothetical protein